MNNEPTTPKTPEKKTFLPPSLSSPDCSDIECLFYTQPKVSDKTESRTAVTYTPLSATDVQVDNVEADRVESEDSKPAAPKKLNYAKVNLADDWEEEMFEQWKEDMEPGESLDTTPDAISKVAKAVPVKMEREEKKRSKVGKKQKDKTWILGTKKDDAFFMECFNHRSEHSKKYQALECQGCKEGMVCEWDTTFGVRMRLYSAEMRRKYGWKNHQIRFSLYRLYVHVRHKKKYRNAIPFCVEVEIKRTYPGYAPGQKGFTWYNDGEKKDTV
jgi:hypothetical protein